MDYLTLIKKLELLKGHKSPSNANLVLPPLNGLNSAKNLNIKKLVSLTTTEKQKLVLLTPTNNLVIKPVPKFKLLSNNLSTKYFLKPAITPAQTKKPLSFSKVQKIEKPKKLLPPRKEESLVTIK